MTPFMLEVQALLEGEPARAPETVASPNRTVAQAADAQFLVRALAEQLVSEANAVLAQQGRCIELVDQVGSGQFAFTLGYRDRSARIETLVHGRSATGYLRPPGETVRAPQELSSDDELQSLLLTLIAG